MVEQYRVPYNTWYSYIIVRGYILPDQQQYHAVRKPQVQPPPLRRAPNPGTATTTVPGTYQYCLRHVDEQKLLERTRVMYTAVVVQLLC